MIKEFFKNLAGGGETAEGEEKVNHLRMLWDAIRDTATKVFEAIAKAWPTISQILGQIIQMIGI